MKTSSLQSKRRGHYYDSIRETNGQVYPLKIKVILVIVGMMQWFQESELIRITLVY